MTMYDPTFLDPDDSHYRLRFIEDWYNIIERFLSANNLDDIYQRHGEDWWDDEFEFFETDPVTHSPVAVKVVPLDPEERKDMRGIQLAYGQNDHTVDLTNIHGEYFKNGAVIFEYKAEEELNEHEKFDPRITAREIFYSRVEYEHWKQLAIYKFQDELTKSAEYLQINRDTNLSIEDYFEQSLDNEVLRKFMDDPLYGSYVDPEDYDLIPHIVGYDKDFNPIFNRVRVLVDYNKLTSAEFEEIEKYFDDMEEDGTIYIPVNFARTISNRILRVYYQDYSGSARPYHYDHLIGDHDQEISEYASDEDEEWLDVQDEVNFIDPEDEDFADEDDYYAPEDEDDPSDSPVLSHPEFFMGDRFEDLDEDMNPRSEAWEDLYVVMRKPDLDLKFHKKWFYLSNSWIAGTPFDEIAQHIVYSNPGMFRAGQFMDIYKHVVLHPELYTLETINDIAIRYRKMADKFDDRRNKLLQESLEEFLEDLDEYRDWGLETFTGETLEHFKKYLSEIPTSLQVHGVDSMAIYDIYNIDNKQESEIGIKRPWKFDRYKRIRQMYDWFQHPNVVDYATFDEYNEALDDYVQVMHHYFKEGDPYRPYMAYPDVFYPQTIDNDYEPFEEDGADFWNHSMELLDFVEEYLPMLDEMEEYKEFEEMMENPLGYTDEDREEVFLTSGRDPAREYPLRRRECEVFCSIIGGKDVNQYLDFYDARDAEAANALETQQDSYLMIENHLNDLDQKASEMGLSPFQSNIYQQLSPDARKRQAYLRQREEAGEPTFDFEQFDGGSSVSFVGSYHHTFEDCAKVLMEYSKPKFNFDLVRTAVFMMASQFRIDFTELADAGADFEPEPFHTVYELNNQLARYFFDSLAYNSDLFYENIPIIMTAYKYYLDSMVVDLSLDITESVLSYFPEQLHSDILHIAEALAERIVEVGYEIDEVPMLLDRYEQNLKELVINNPDILTLQQLRLFGTLFDPIKDRFVDEGNNLITYLIQSAANGGDYIPYTYPLTSNLIESISSDGSRVNIVGGITTETLEDFYVRAGGNTDLYPDYARNTHIIEKLRKDTEFLYNSKAPMLAEIYKERLLWKEKMHRKHKVEEYYYLNARNFPTYGEDISSPKDYYYHYYGGDLSMVEALHDAFRATFKVEPSTYTPSSAYEQYFGENAEGDLGLDLSGDNNDVGRQFFFKNRHIPTSTAMSSVADPDGLIDPNNPDHLQLVLAAYIEHSAILTLPLNSDGEYKPAMKIVYPTVDEIDFNIKLSPVEATPATTPSVATLTTDVSSDYDVMRRNRWIRYNEINIEEYYSPHDRDFHIEGAPLSLDDAPGYYTDDMVESYRQVAEYYLDSADTSLLSGADPDEIDEDYGFMDTQDRFISPFESGRLTMDEHYEHVRIMLGPEQDEDDPWFHDDLLDFRFTADDFTEFKRRARSYLRSARFNADLYTHTFLKRFRKKNLAKMSEETRNGQATIDPEDFLNFHVMHPERINMEGASILHVDTLHTGFEHYYNTEPFRRYFSHDGIAPERVYNVFDQTKGESPLLRTIYYPDVEHDPDQMQDYISIFSHDRTDLHDYLRYKNFLPNGIPSFLDHEHAKREYSLFKKRLRMGNYDFKNHRSLEAMQRYQEQLKSNIYYYQYANRYDVDIEDVPGIDEPYREYRKYYPFGPLSVEEEKELMAQVDGPGVRLIAPTSEQFENDPQYNPSVLESRKRQYVDDYNDPYNLSATQEQIGIRFSHIESYYRHDRSMFILLSRRYRVLADLFHKLSKFIQSLDNDIHSYVYDPKLNEYRQRLIEQSQPGPEYYSAIHEYYNPDYPPHYYLLEQVHLSTPYNELQSDEQRRVQQSLQLRKQRHTFNTLTGSPELTDYQLSNFLHETYLSFKEYVRSNAPLFYYQFSNHQKYRETIVRQKENVGKELDRFADKLNEYWVKIEDHRSHRTSRNEYWSKMKIYHNDTIPLYNNMVRENLFTDYTYDQFTDIIRKHIDIEDTKFISPAQIQMIHSVRAKILTLFQSSTYAYQLYPHFPRDSSELREFIDETFNVQQIYNIYNVLESYAFYIKERDNLRKVIDYTAYHTPERISSRIHQNIDGTITVDHISGDPTKVKKYSLVTPSLADAILDDDTKAIDVVRRYNELMGYVDTSILFQPHNLFRRPNMGTDYIDAEDVDAIYDRLRQVGENRDLKYIYKDLDDGSRPYTYDNLAQYEDEDEDDYNPYPDLLASEHDMQQHPMIKPTKRVPLMDSSMNMYKTEESPPTKVVNGHNLDDTSHDQEPYFPSSLNIALTYDPEGSSKYLTRKSLKERKKDKEKAFQQQNKIEYDDVDIGKNDIINLLEQIHDNVEGDDTQSLYVRRVPPPNDNLPPTHPDVQNQLVFDLPITPDIDNENYIRNHADFYNPEKLDEAKEKEREMIEKDVRELHDFAKIAPIDAKNTFHRLAYERKRKQLLQRQKRRIREQRQGQQPRTKLRQALSKISDMDKRIKDRLEYKTLGKKRVDELVQILDNTLFKTTYQHHFVEKFAKVGADSENPNHDFEIDPDSLLHPLYIDNYGDSANIVKRMNPLFQFFLIPTEITLYKFYRVDTTQNVKELEFKKHINNLGLNELVDILAEVDNGTYHLELTPPQYSYIYQRYEELKTIHKNNPFFLDDMLPDAVATMTDEEYNHYQRYYHDNLADYFSGMHTADELFFGVDMIGYIGYDHLRKKFYKLIRNEPYPVEVSEDEMMYYLNHKNIRSLCASEPIPSFKFYENISLHHPNVIFYREKIQDKLVMLERLLHMKAQPRPSLYKMMRWVFDDEYKIFEDGKGPQPYERKYPLFESDLAWSGSHADPAPYMRNGELMYTEYDLVKLLDEQEYTVKQSPYVPSAYHYGLAGSKGMTMWREPFIYQDLRYDLHRYTDTDDSPFFFGYDDTIQVDRYDREIFPGNNVRFTY